MKVAEFGISGSFSTVSDAHPFTCMCVIINLLHLQTKTQETVYKGVWYEVCVVTVATGVGHTVPSYR